MPVKPSVTDETSQIPQKLSWWGKLLSFLGMGSMKDREKVLILKNIRNLLKQTGRKYFQVGTDMVEPALAKLFHDIYVCLGPAQTLFQNIQSSVAIKTIIIEGGLSPDVLTIARQLDDDSIQKRAKDIPNDQLAQETEKAFTLYSEAFTPELRRKIEGRYNLLLIFLDLLKFNYFFLLKKFDSNLSERSSSYKPRFERINAAYIVDDLKEFWEVGLHIPLQAEWDVVFDSLKAYKNVEPLNRSWWNRALQHIASLQRSDLLPLIIQHVTQDPTYQVLSKPPRESLIEVHLATLKTRLESLLNKLKTENKMNAITKLVTEVFGSENVSRTKFYTEKANASFSKRAIGGYQYIDAVNYLKAFLLDFCKKDLRELVNYLVVKGQWFVQEQSKPLSESVHRLMEISDRLIQFDDSLSEDSEVGAKIKSHLLKPDRDFNATTILKTIIRDANGQAKTLLMESGNELISAGRMLKGVIEDYAKSKPEVLMNWKQLESGTEPRFKERMGAVYRKIYNFVQLLQFYIREG